MVPDSYWWIPTSGFKVNFAEIHGFLGRELEYIKLCARMRWSFDPSQIEP